MRLKGQAAAFLFLLTTVSEPTLAQVHNVTCTATQGFHCMPESGCRKDATYVTQYRVDLEQQTVTELTVKHTVRDQQPQPGSAVYRIISSVPTANVLLGERSVTAVGRSGLTAVETILIGETSYLSSSVSSAGTRVFVMVGKCAGL